MKPILSLLAVVAVIAGCATPVRRSHLEELANLPHPKGAYVGSMIPGPPWLYFGSDARYHYFRYTYTGRISVHARNLKIPRAELTLNFEHPFQSYKTPGTEVVPEYLFGTVIGFVRSVRLTPEDEAWTRRVAPLPTFDEHL